MNDMVKNSIEARKSAFYNAYNIDKQEIKDKIEELFNRINEFGESCSDAMDFETKFASSSLNQEYINLFTTVATSCTPITYETTNNVQEKTTGQEVMEEVGSELKYQLDSATQPLRREAYQQTYDAVRDIPVVGDVMNVKQHVDFFSRFKKKKDEDDKEEK